MADEDRSGPARIIVADDHPIVRAGLRQMLSGQSDLEVVGEASDGREAVELCRHSRPDLALMDIRMPNMSGIEAAREIKRESPSTIVLILTALEDPNFLMEALKAGASGYVLKYASAQETISAIRKVLTHDASLDQGLATQLFARLIDEKQKKEGTEELASSKRSSDERANLPLAEPLTLREVEILRLLVQGQTNQQIARTLYISVSTVKNHVHHIITKLEVSDRIQAALLAVQRGLISVGTLQLIVQWLTDLRLDL